MWAAAPMTAFRVQCDIRSFEKSVYLLIVSSIKVDFYGIQADFSCMSFFKISYDWLYFSQEYSGSRQR